MHAFNEHIAKDGFRLRGTSMSRLDGFSDVVFGFALTLLVVSLEVPKTYIELRNVLLGFLPFSICFPVSHHDLVVALPVFSPLRSA
jgi:uncharacterized membrane protein